MKAFLLLALTLACGSKPASKTGSCVKLDYAFSRCRDEQAKVTCWKAESYESGIYCIKDGQ